MLLVMVLGLGVGLLLAGSILVLTGVFLSKRMRSPALVRWSGGISMLAGSLLLLIAIFW